MTANRLAKLAKDLDALHGKHLAHPAILLVQPEDGKQIFLLMVGSPSREWLCHVLDDLLQRMGVESFLLPTKVN